ncbi:Vacuolar membrane protein [Cladophialophora carrionii]|uniref:Vacuolar membrane protein n=1 Tax=Cladophialophora carrionii TaxID=86049 RepID=A0A1C1CCS1_9EURO|nr:Vacuolar membrane protein [Cladophialophora carrionii]
MHPPGLPPSPAAQLDHDIVSALQTSSPPSLAVTGTSLIFSIATAAASQTLASIPNPAKSPAAPMSDDDESSGECKLLGPFAILVQAALGALALLSLVFKRWRERPQRPLKVWSFDVSKQVVGSVLLHLLNLLMSMFSSGQIGESVVNAAATTLGAETTEAYQPNPCSFYLLNLAIDTTLGIPILIGILKILTIGARYTPLARPPESIESGHYGTPPKAGWWAKQCLLYFLGLIGMKICVFIIFQLCPWLGRVGDWALRWTEGNEAVQIAFVMFIFPLIMNALQYYIIDTFIKQKNRPQLDGGEHNERERDGEHGALLAEDGPGDGRSVDEDEAHKARNVSPSPKRSDQLERIISYDPDKDGELDSTRQDGASSSLTAEAEDEAIEHRPRI